MDRLLIWAGVAIVALIGLFWLWSTASHKTSSVEVQVTVSEYAFKSSLTTFATDKVYHFKIMNAGSTAHDWMIMPAGETDESKALVKIEDSDLKPGVTLTRDFTFNQSGEFEVACHVEGHYEKGMKLLITAH